MQPNWNNMTNGTTVQGSYSCPDGGVFGIVCPSVCLSDWDKRKTPVTNRCSATTCDGRVVNQRRGQDLNLRNGEPVHRVSNPALSTTQPPLRTSVF
jgi:hypothetical protein